MTPTLILVVLAIAVLLAVTARCLNPDERSSDAAYPRTGSGLEPICVPAKGSLTLFLDKHLHYQPLIGCRTRVVHTQYSSPAPNDGGTVRGVLLATLVDASLRS
jgi:hypothetical protein